MELKIYLTNLGKHNEGELVGNWVNVLSQPDWTKELADIGVADDTQYEEFFITDYETDIDGLKITEYMSLDELRELADNLSNIEDYDEKAFKAAVECWGLDDALCIIASGDYTFYPDIKDDEDLGRELAYSGYIEIPDRLVNYIDYAAIGRDFEIEAEGGLTAQGFILKHHKKIIVM